MSFGSPAPSLSAIPRLSELKRNPALIPKLELGAFGLELIPLTIAQAGDDALVELLARWRAQHAAVYPTQFPVTYEGTRGWLLNSVLADPDRLMFLAVDPTDQEQLPVGHLGLDHAGADASMGLSNLVVGDRRRMPSGVMAAAVSRLLDWAYDDLRVTSVWSVVFTDHVAPIRMLRRIGFVDDGRIAARRHASGERVEYRRRAPEDLEPADRWWLHSVHDRRGDCDRTRLGIGPVGLEATAELSEATLARALDLAVGAIHIPCAPRAQQRLGAMLAHLAPRPVPPLVFTIADGAADTAAAALRRVGVGRAAVALLDVELLNDARLEPAWAATVELVERGLAGRVGLAGATRAQLGRAHSVAPVGAVRIAATALESELGRAASALGVGLILHGVAPLPDPVGTRLPCTPLELAIARLLTRLNVEAVSLRARSPAEVNSWSSAHRVRLLAEDEAALTAPCL
jgi:RimJ/RimL family protein N-acetyltransferase